MDLISSTLGSLPAILWGDRAVASLDIGLVCENYLLVIDDASLDKAAELLKEAGFREAPWSYGSCDDPSTFTGRKMQEIHRDIAQEYRNLDEHSTRFRFPTEDQAKARVVLLPSSYTHITLTPATEEKLIREDNIFYPDAVSLVESFVRTLVAEPEMSLWTSSLEMWVITNLYGELMLNDDILDSCDDEAVKAWFNENIARDSGGIDRVTCTKKLGRVGYDESLARKK